MSIVCYILARGDFEAFWIPVIIVAVIGLAIFGHLQAKKRREALAKLARSMGLSFTGGKDYGMDERFGQFSCLREGSRRYAHNILAGAVNRRNLTAFDYHYETYSRNSKGHRTTHHHYFSAVIIEAALPLTPLAIRPENFFDKVTEFFGYDDIDFESNEFSREFHVSSPDKKWAFDVIHQETMEFLLQMPRFHIEFQGRYVIAYRKSRFDVNEFQLAISLVEGLLDRFPEYLLRELKGVDR